MSDIHDSTAEGLQVLGLCRFSVPTKDAFQTTQPTQAEKRAFLYDPARLDYRFAWFENMLLPSIAAQRDKAFRLIVMMGHDFPEPWRSRMEGHIAAHPQLVAEYVPYSFHRRRVGIVMAKHSDPKADAIAQFRLDDDDAVAIDFVRSLRSDYLDLESYFHHQERMALEYGRGMVVLDRGDGALGLRPVVTHFWSAALAIFTRPGDGHHLLEKAHYHTWRSMPAVSNTDEFMFLRGEHGTNDSKTALPFQRIEMDREDVIETLRLRFEVDLEALRRAVVAARDPASV
ncbi:glycosyltransferase [Maritimibacter dapengensis]|uniref:Rhamnosyl transferase n=1 Tax=Maritimibacter dapengensis TaxID=2836868 RepID=A0ABS6T5H8_9RHOB|nr:glycosyltransferase [Maritimibacter dapengensis]MBV7380512.1 putative rhamnosyl transferase [Maritimibacter dapengensis]